MSNAWGAAWGNAWGDAWGTSAIVTPPTVNTPSGGTAWRMAETLGTTRWLLRITGVARRGTAQLVIDVDNSRQMRADLRGRRGYAGGWFQGIENEDDLFGGLL